ncbi:DEAD/DEAH box helicase [Haladaptatus pallidirubidus]|uniref:DEAD/DEAH box helicase n=1 Tax=Haladaptatus pallidirubidus TaxID=1008152 RepID=A0AAV3UBK1_9EURY|nr:DEAD/DEAH box helicase [Haladaptatus pallidirubidus]
MQDTIDWLRGRPYYEGQIARHETISGNDGEFREISLESRLESALADRGIDRLYRHQADGVEAVRDGNNLVIATRTASGKSLAYTIPAFERAIDHGGRTLYIAPQNALINDQEDTLSELARDLGFGSRVSVDQYTGRLDKNEKRAVRDRRPTVVLTTPDMLHYALLPYAHRLWHWFFKGLETVVIDEVHEYRGVFGSHVALVLRRLARICDRFDSAPQFVCCSATIGNPVEHASAVTGQPESSFRLVDEDASRTGPTHWVLWNPPEYEDPNRGSGRRKSSHAESKRLFADLVTRDYQTLVFTRARQAAERYAMESTDELRRRGEHGLASKISAYQAALRNDRRRELESGLHSGEVRGAWSTNALELGVDIGGLDAVLLDGYPGTRMAAFQQAGRAGRGTDASLVTLVAGEDQLDQFLMRNPDELFAGDPERAVANPENEELLPSHVTSAARETWLSANDERYFGEGFPELVSNLESSGQLKRRQTNEGIRWVYDGDGSPQHEMSLRSIDEREIDLLDRSRNDVISSLPFSDALSDAHPGSVYHHQGQSYEVVDLDLSKDVAELSPTWADYHTKTLHEKEITVESDTDEKTLSTRDDCVVRFADVTMRKRITGFERRDAKRGETLGKESLSLPELTLRTKALYFTIPEDVEQEIRAMGGDFGGAIHAAEHGMISLFPLELLCDRRDIGGLSTPVHPHTGKSTIFIYDGYPGGVGLTREGYETVESLMRNTGEMIRACDCESGCPSCVQSPHCGNANEPLDKRLSAHLLSLLTE